MDYPRDRLTVVESIYHRSVGNDPAIFDSRFSRELLGTEQPWGPRRLTATGQPQKLDLGWIDTTGLLIIRNDVGRDLRANPTPEEIQRAKKQILRIQFSPDDSHGWLVYPKETFRGVPTSDIYVISLFEETPFTIFVIPA